MMVILSILSLSQTQILAFSYSSSITKHGYPSTHQSPVSFQWISPTLQAYSWIQDNLWWRIQENWSPRDSSKPIFGPNQSLWSKIWVLIAPDFLSESTLHQCIELWFPHSFYLRSPWINVLSSDCLRVAIWDHLGFRHPSQQCWKC